ncbi:MAG: hypothetical protein LBS69_11195 [Prevotellaceae bacterium]|jgi:hypothetical protein|nr:hypothetical protein [Prevotellaceae bacterium]
MENNDIDLKKILLSVLLYTLKAIRFLGVAVTKAADFGIEKIKSSK